MLAALSAVATEQSLNWAGESSFSAGESRERGCYNIFGSREVLV